MLEFCLTWTPQASYQHGASVGGLPPIEDDCFGDFLGRVLCRCGTSRHTEPETLARLVGSRATLAALAKRMRSSQCGRKVAEVVAVARPRPRGRGRSPRK
jgi:hypothetical protein